MKAERSAKPSRGLLSDPPSGSLSLGLPGSGTRYMERAEGRASGNFD